MRLEGAQFLFLSSWGKQIIEKKIIDNFKYDIVLKYLGQLPKIPKYFTKIYSWANPKSLDPAQN